MMQRHVKNKYQHEMWPSCGSSLLWLPSQANWWWIKTWWGQLVIFSSCSQWDEFSSVLWHCWLGDIRASWSPVVYEERMRPDQCFRILFSALTLMVGWQEGRLTNKIPGCTNNPEVLFCRHNQLAGSPWKTAIKGKYTCVSKTSTLYFWIINN